MKKSIRSSSKSAQILTQIGWVLILATSPAFFTLILTQTPAHAASEQKQLTSANSEKILGPVVMVERTYYFNLDLLVAGLTESQWPSGFRSQIAVYAPTGTESLISPDARSNSPSYTTERARVFFNHNALGYGVMVFPLSSTTPKLSSEEAIQALKEVFQANDLGKQAFVARVSLVK